MKITITLLLLLPLTLSLQQQQQQQKKNNVYMNIFLCLQVLVSVEMNDSISQQDDGHMFR